MPAYDHLCKNCGHEWEDVYSIHAEVPQLCPNCKKEGHVQRLISCATPGKVELQGRELVEKLRGEGKELARKARRDPSLAADLFGPNYGR